MVWYNPFQILAGLARHSMRKKQSIWYKHRISLTNAKHSFFTIQGSRLPGAIAAVKARAPVLGGNFGIWGTMFSTFDCTVKGIRQKEDYWNSIIAGFMTGGSLAIRAGPKTAVGSGIMCGILLGCFEGVGALIQRLTAEGHKPVAPIM